MISNPKEKPLLTNNSLYFLKFLNKKPSRFLLFCYNNCIISRNLTYKKIIHEKNNKKNTTANDNVSVSICSSPVLVRDDTLKYPIYA